MNQTNQTNQMKTTENVLEIKGLCKRYPAFALDDVSFSVKRGHICGFIGRNGAGKTTTLKSIFNIVHPDAGEARFFGGVDEIETKRRVGFVSGGADYYPLKKLSAIAKVTRGFYDNWDEAAYRGLMSEFALDERKTPRQLSAGMRVKFALALAMSHNARLLVLDEPTSGLDPISRDELTTLFLRLVDRGASILFSTHVTSDLEKCADDIVYIRSGKIAADEPLSELAGGYHTVHLPRGDELPEELLTGKKRAKEGYTALLRSGDAKLAAGLECVPATLDDIMIHLEKSNGIKSRG